MSLNYSYILTVTDDETGDQIAHIEAKSWESLEESKRKLDSVIEKYEEEKAVEFDHNKIDIHLEDELE